MPQLILTQAEIEEALVDYTHKLFDVREGSTINVELKATRGETGATAIIDILKPGQVVINHTPTVKAEPVKQTAPAKAAPAKVTATKVTPVTKTLDELEAENPEGFRNPGEEGDTTGSDDEEDFRTAALGNSTSDVATEANAEEVTNEAAEEVAEPEPETKPKSLFAGLRKPKND